MNCLDAALDGAFDQRARVHGVVAVVAERIGDRVRYHDRGGEMDDGVTSDARRSDAATSAWSPVSPITTGTSVGHRPGKSGAQVVEHDDALAGVAQSVDHVAADIAGAAGNQDRHQPCPIRIAAVDRLYCSQAIADTRLQMTDRHCERSEAIYSSRRGTWIASKASPSRNDESMFVPFGMIITRTKYA